MTSDGPVVKTSLSSVGNVGLIPDLVATQVPGSLKIKKKKTPKHRNNKDFKKKWYMLKRKSLKKIKM